MRLLAAFGSCAFAVGVLGAQPALKSGLDLTALDRSVRPQDDLYRFVNGGWIDKAEIPPDRVYHDAFTELGDKTELDLRAIIEETTASNRKGHASARQIGDLYASLMDEARIEALGPAPIEPELRKIDAITTTKQLAAEMGTLTATAAGGPFAEVIELDAREPGVPIVRVAQGGTLLPDRDYYLASAPQYADLRGKYEAYLAGIFTLTHRRNARADAQAVVALETVLARAQWTQAESRDRTKTNTKFALASLADEMPGFDWNAWARPQGIDRTPNIILAQPSFFKTFSALIPTTPLGTWKAWLAARYITACAPYVNTAFGDARFEFFGRALTGQQLARPRWKRAVGLVNMYLGDAVGRLYAEQHFVLSTKARMQQLVADLLAAFRESIAQADWMSDVMKRRALGRLATLSIRIGVPEEWRDYGGLVIKPDDLIGNIRRAEQFENDDRLGRVREPRVQRTWLMTPQTVNAYYSPAANEIVLPAAVLQPPLFDADADAAANYGGIGAFLGHEIGHAFDEGRRNPEYLKRAHMLEEQFSAYRPVADLHVNGALTLRENIGDLGGVSLAYRAYKIYLNGRPAPVIDGFTGEQRFFMGWAQIWRSKVREEYLRQWLLSVAHAPPQYRANGSVGNMTAFYDAFHVQPGDTLYRDPPERVTIW